MLIFFKKFYRSIIDIFSIDFDVNYQLEEAEIYNELERHRCRALTYMPPMM